MAGLIKTSGGKSANNKPIIIGFIQSGEIGTDSFSIKYTAIDKDNIPLIHNIYINGEKKNISTEVGANNINREFSYTLINLKPETEYRLQLEVSDGKETVLSNIINVTTKKIYIYGIKVMENNSNPESCCTYIEDAIGITTANSTGLNGWANIYPFNEIKLVGFKQGKETGEINPNNKKYYIDGSQVQSDVDVMVKIPKIYWDFKNITNGYELRISKYKFNSTCGCYAHKVGEVEKDFIYVGAYLGYVESGKLRSKSGVKPTAYINITQSRTYAQAVGAGYQQWNWFTFLLLQILYLISYKNLNSGAALGLGCISNSTVKNTGETDTKGMIFGNQNKTTCMCFLGVENFYDNLLMWVDGVSFDGTNVTVTPDNKTFNSTGSGYTKVGSSSHLNYGYMNGTVHTNQGGFFPKAVNGTDNTYYSDLCGSFTGKFGLSGGRFKDNMYAGAFALYVTFESTIQEDGLGTRLCYLG